MKKSLPLALTLACAPALCFALRPAIAADSTAATDIATVRARYVGRSSCSTALRHTCCHARPRSDRSLDRHASQPYPSRYRDRTGPILTAALPRRVRRSAVPVPRPTSSKPESGSQTVSLATASGRTPPGRSRHKVSQAITGLNGRPDLPRSQRKIQAPVFLKGMTISVFRWRRRSWLRPRRSHAGLPYRLLRFRRLRSTFSARARAAARRVARQFLQA
jgi:hypothetical protein